MATNAIQEINEAELAAAVARSRQQGTALVLQVHATWCGPCKAYGPIVDAAAGEYAGRATFLRLNFDHAPRAVQGLGVQVVPATFIYKGGRVVEGRTGVLSLPALRNLLNAHL